MGWLLPSASSFLTVSPHVQLPFPEMSLGQDHVTWLVLVLQERQREVAVDGVGESRRGPDGSLREFLGE